VSDERRDEVLEIIERRDTGFTCHKHSIANRDVICRGDYDRDPRRTVAMRLAHLLGLLRFIDLEGREVP